MKVGDAWRIAPPSLRVTSSVNKCLKKDATVLVVVKDKKVVSVRRTKEGASTAADRKCLSRHFKRKKDAVDLKDGSYLVRVKR